MYFFNNSVFSGLLIKIKSASFIGNLYRINLSWFLVPRTDVFVCFVWVSAICEIQDKNKLHVLELSDLTHYR